MKDVCLYRHRGGLLSYDKAREFWRKGIPFDFLNIRQKPRVWRRVRLAPAHSVILDRQYIQVLTAPDQREGGWTRRR